MQSFINEILNVFFTARMHKESVRQIGPLHARQQIPEKTLS
jgi:hypothetical protein